MEMAIRRCLLATVAGGVMLVAAPLYAQPGPPVDNTVALEGTVDSTYKAANTIAVKTIDGVRHLFHITDKTVVHGAEAKGGEALQGLENGSRVVVHYAGGAGKEAAVEVDRIDGRGLKTVEGVVTHVDRAGRRITVRLADGTEQTLRLTDRAASDVGTDVDAAARDTSTVIVYYADEGGERVAHYFKKTRK